MHIKIKTHYKSIKEECEFDLPDFSIFTGLNGSGKTHLLEAIANSQISEVTTTGEAFKNIRYIGFNELNPNIQETCDPRTITNHIKNVWAQFSNAIKRLTPPQHTNETAIQQLSDENMKKFLQRTFEKTSKQFKDITEHDLIDNFDISFMGQNDFLVAQFALIFKNYHVKLEENDINAYYLSIGKEINSPVLSKEEFISKHGTPPWDFINEILEETNIPYAVNNPTGTRIDSSFEFRLIDKGNGLEIKSVDLSTGEKVLMSLALAIYSTGADYGKPDLLLIDEPDAALHPSMSKKMLDVLNNKIVKENKIPTIITTHSPTTVIAAEGISVYQVIRGNNIPCNISIHAAVELLSSDIPFLKISNDQRRQVFVESKYDVIYYEMLSNIYSRIVTLPASPIFIPARTSTGSNCTDVIDIVQNLSSNGNDQIYGIIDWDTSNTSNGRVLVLGENDRYAIENYILDPLLMGLLFIREGKIDILDYGVSTFNTYFETSAMSESDAQLIINKVLSDLNLLTENFVNYKLFNGWNLQVTDEFNTFQGHALESLYKEKYPFLRVHNNEDSLKRDILNKVFSDHPPFTPNVLFETLNSIV